MDDIRKTQQSFARKATALPGHRFDDLYHLISREDWIATALDAVLDNTGSRTAGVDGLSKKHYASETNRHAFIAALCDDLKTGKYQPQPTRRVWIPKANGKQRPLGIPTLQDRVVQMRLKMVLDPIFESDFLPCSNGFRPGRRTMDCMAACYQRITRRNKYFWVIEGDIRQCFDRINHRILLRLLRQRIADRRIIGLISRFLQAGVMEGGLFQTTPEGTPQGGIISPLLANVYLHQLDLWWWMKFGQLDSYAKEKRRSHKLGNCVLTRYADDFILLWNGTRADAEQLRDEVRQFLWEALHLELNLEKTHITHATDGFDFLGFHVRWELPKDNDPWLRVTPSDKSIQKLRDTIKDMTDRRSVNSTPEQKMKAVNRVLRGWINYHRQVSFKRIASKLDWWTTDRMYRWLKKKHGLGARRVLAQYYLCENTQAHQRKNLGVKDSRGHMLYLVQMADVPHSKYLPKTRANPYLDDGPLPKPDAASPIVEVWDGSMSLANQVWDEARHQALERDGYRCTECGSTHSLEVHHLQPQHAKGTHAMRNLLTLCQECHAKTPSYGRSVTTRDGNNDGKPDEGKLSRPVWREG
jgi:RNA-directed DNA polymerase